MKDNYSSYNIEYDDSSYYLIVTINEKIISNAEKNIKIIKEINNITEDINTSIVFSDFSIRCFISDEVENVEDNILFLKSLYSYMDNNYSENYKLYFLNSYKLTLEFPFSFHSIESNNDSYDQNIKLIKEVYNLFDIRNKKNTYKDYFIIKYNDGEYHYIPSTETLDPIK